LPENKLPKNINEPKEYIKELIKKVTININLSNLNDTLLWTDIAEKTLKRFSKLDETLILDLKYNLAEVLIYKSEYSKAKTMILSNIKILLKQNIKKKNILANCYFYLAIVYGNLYDFKNAKKYILSALNIDKNNCGYNCSYARILFLSNDTENGERYFIRAIELSIKKYGKKHLQTASINFFYGISLFSIGKLDLAKIKLIDSYQICKFTLGEDNLYSVRILGHISTILYFEKKYIEAFEKMDVVLSKIMNIFGNNHKETFICKYNCAQMLIKLRKYSKALDYLENSFVLKDNKGAIILLNYNYKYTTMIAPEVYIYKTGSSANKFLKILIKKNIPIRECDIELNNLMKNCSQFHPIPSEYWKIIANILVNIMIDKEILLN
jgi:tetratricopeptide (TPR) repeat protein